MDRAFPRLVAGLLFSAAVAGPAVAGPPYVTDDPEPTDPGRWEIFSFVAGDRVQGATEGEAGLDINYGGAENLQLTLGLPIEYEREHALHRGLGDVEVAAKYRFLRQAEGSALPDVAIFPAVSLPTGTNGFGSRKAGLFLPIWAQKDFGDWSLFGGGGYHVNPGAGSRDFWESGIALTRQFGERLSLGAEVFHQTADEVGGRAFTGVNFGAQYRLNSHWSLLGSGGPGVQNHRDGGDYIFYVALRADY